MEVRKSKKRKSVRKSTFNLATVKKVSPKNNRSTDFVGLLRWNVQFKCECGGMKMRTDTKNHRHKHKLQTYSVFSTTNIHIGLATALAQGNNITVAANETRKEQRK